MADVFANWQLRYAQQAFAADADQTEWAAIRLGTTNIDSGIRDELLAGQIMTALAREETSACITDEIERRAAVLGPDYPFQRFGNSLRYRNSGSHAYEFCLSISFLDSLSTAFGRRFQIAFERLVRDVLICLLGRVGVIGRRLGVPGDGLENRPPDIKAMVEELHGLSGKQEWTWNPKTGYPATPSLQDLGDLGMDVVVWNPFPDNRGSNLYFVGQCACGLSDWNQKFDEPNEGRLAGWINAPVTNAPFVRVFAVPFHIPNLAFLGDVSRSCKGITLDRARIVLLASRRGSKSFIRSAARESYGLLLRDAIRAGRVVPRVQRRRRKRGAVGRHFL